VVHEHAALTYLSHRINNGSDMKSSTIRTSVDLPRSLHRKLHEEAARKGCSARQLILSAIEQAIEPPRRGRGRLNLERPLVKLQKPVSVTNEQIYELGIP
jgi:hypothetical protein